MVQNYEAARRHLDERFKEMGSTGLFAPPSKGWIRAIRDALGMSTTQLAKRLGVVQSRVVAIEQDEVEDALTLNSLRRAAEAMECELVYAIVPKDSLMDIVERRSYEKARGVMKQVKHNMSLEEQSVKAKEHGKQFKKLASKFLQGSPRKLWED